MKKSILFVVSVLFVSLALTACTSETPKAKEAAGTQSKAASVAAESVSDNIVESTAPINTNQNAFETFSTGLDNLNIEYEKITMGAELVGAVQGIKYQTAEGNIELYRFDEDSESLKKAEQNKSLELEGFGAFPAEVQGNYAMLIDELPQKDSIIELFNELK